MKALWLRLDSWFKQREKREQWLLAGVFVGLLGWFAWLLLVEPTQKALTASESRQRQAEQALAQLESQIAELRAQTGRDPNAEQAERRRQLMNQNDRLSRQLDQKAEFVPPEALLVWMQALLDSSGQLRLREFDTQPPVSFLSRAASSSSSSSSRDGAAGNTMHVYQHPVSVKLEGDYFAVHDYLVRLSQLPIAFYWQGFEYQVSQYPTAQVTLELFTLSYQGENR